MNDYLQQIIADSLQQFELEELPEIQTEAPKDASHGDASTNVAMMLAKPLRNNPRAIAQQIIDGLKYDEKKISSVEIAGPGFINFRFAEDYLYDELQSILDAGSGFGRTDEHSGKKVLVEFVSANPTGPLTVGHGRNAVLGDTVARLLEWTGAEVDREYYFNDAGRQMRVLGQSVQARYLEKLGKESEFPEGGYEGEYIRDIAAELAKENAELSGNIEDWKPFKEKAEEAIFADISNTLQRMNINMDSFFNEHSLYADGSIDSTVEKLREKELAYDKDGAVWFKTTEFGKEQDTVLIKSTGEPTYRLPDIAYHMNKLDRGYDICLDVFGADHIATYPDVLSGISALGYDKEKVDVVIYQFVTIVKDGQPFKMSTRKANFVTLDELMDEVGSDVTRFFFLMRSPNTHLEFDIAQAKEAGDKNPVFYLQYAHARISSVLRKAMEEYSFSNEANLSLLKHPSEESLIKTILRFPEMITSAANAREPHRLINFLNDVASAFTSFYHDCRIIGVEEDLAQARIELAKSTAQVLRNGLTILGISAPENM
ncbi:MAG TPA: arginine--tRNA ligase [Planctomycetaceae bacterium]|nr:arginine--tRNA ligase [Bacteroidota bacterium]MAC05854.1 arginine--tRNA ligase [Balneola sp.]HAH43365.1 arginine--tRNA ligase [Planctomycetaceae bacterium]MAO77379.1 arginine--tRNA ligase [Balneola sp.]MBF65337.1 arginine--tRNA ligase [Balneola sp.]